MFKIVKSKGKVTLSGSGVEHNVLPGDQGITDLDCSKLEVVMKFDVSGNRGLRSLKNGPSVVNTYVAVKCGLEELECPELSVSWMFRVSGNPNLRSLRNGPKYVGEYVASRCGLEGLDCAELVVTGMFSIDGNPNLRSLKNCPRAVTLEADPGMAVLFAVNRIKRITLDDARPEPVGATVFRYKLDLINRGRKINARFVAENKSSTPDRGT